jgi:hypothetical protein
MSRSDFFSMFEDEMKEIGKEEEDIPSQGTFNQVWRTQFRHLKIPRHNTLGGCDTCIQLKTAMRDAERGSKLKRAKKSQFKAHMDLVRKERREQTVRDQSANLDPSQSWTITTDFMQDIYMPWKCKRPKSWYSSLIIFHIISQAQKKICALASVWLYECWYRAKVSIGL